MFKPTNVLSNIEIFAQNISKKITSCFNHFSFEMPVTLEINLLNKHNCYHFVLFFPVSDVIQVATSDIHIGYKNFLLPEHGKSIFFSTFYAEVFNRIFKI